MPALVKLSNLVPGGGVWLNTQRPEWNDANNALAGWGLSVVTSAISAAISFSWSVCWRPRAPRQMEKGCRESLRRWPNLWPRCAAGPWKVEKLGALDDARRFDLFEALGRAGEAHRRAVYAGGPEEWRSVPVAEVRALIARALSLVEETLSARTAAPTGCITATTCWPLNARATAARPVRHMYLMLEGQVAAFEQRDARRRRRAGAAGSAAPQPVLP